MGLSASVLETVAGRAGDPDELARRAGSYRETDAPDAPVFEMKMGGGGEACCESLAVHVLRGTIGCAILSPESHGKRQLHVLRSVTRKARRM
jgi:hypothetical protein